MKRILKFGTVAMMLAAFTFASCSKDNEDDEQKTLSKKVTKIAYTEDDYTFTTYFDSEGRCTSSQDDSGSRTWTYQYSGNKITSTLIDIDDDGDYTFVSNYTMENGIIVSEENKYGISLYNHSADGYISTIQYEGGKTIFNVKNGDLISISREDEGVIEYELSFEYGSTKNNLNVDLWFEILEEEPLFGLYGKKFEKLPSAMKCSDGKSSYTINFTYEYDGNYLKKIITQYGHKEKPETFFWEIFYE